MPKCACSFLFILDKRKGVFFVGFLVKKKGLLRAPSHILEILFTYEKLEQTVNGRYSLTQLFMPKKRDPFKIPFLLTLEGKLRMTCVKIGKFLSNMITQFNKTNSFYGIREFFALLILDTKYHTLLFII